MMKVETGDHGYVLEDVPHLTGYLDHLPTYPNPLRSNPAYSVVKQYFVNVDDTVPQKIVDDMKYTVSHVVEPVERGFSKINEKFQQISENVKRLEELKKKSKDDSYVIPLNSWSKEFSGMHDNLVEGSCSDSNMLDVKRKYSRSKESASQFKRR